MVRRVINPKDKRYKDYGGRGIDIDPRWVKSFENFVGDMGYCPPGMSIERIDNNKGYWKRNCKWATKEEQYSNMRSNRFMTARGRTLTMSAWARELNVDVTSLLYRLRKGMSEEEAIVTPFIRRDWKVSRAQCLRCGHEWVTKVKRPKICANCGMNPHKKPHHKWGKETLYEQRRNRP
jgi:hypothetical protein